LTSRKSIVDAFLKKLGDGGYHEVDIRFTDVKGFWRHVTVPASAAGTRLFSHGIGFDGSTLDVMTPTEAGDLVLVPDPRRAFEDPFSEKPTMALIADIMHPGTNKPFSRDPRGVAKRARDHMRNISPADESYWAPEFEFYLFDGATFWNRPGSLGYDLRSIETGHSHRKGGRHGLTHPPDSAYHSIHPSDSLHDVRSEIVYHLQSAGVRVKYHHHEVGRSGQVEVEVDFAPFLSSADNVMLTKHIVKNVALRYGLSSTFMPKPLDGEPGSGMHFHMYLAKGKDSLFYDEEGYCSLSGTARSAVAGILHHAPALCAFTNSTTNSYRRLVQNQEAPVYRFFSGPNRTAAIRIPSYARTAENIRIEYRVPDGASNPYLSMSSILMAAIDGIGNEMNPEKMGFGPIDQNVYASGYRASDLKTLPRTLDEALDALEADRSFLEEGDVFKPDLIDEYIHAKREEADRFRGCPHPLEHSLYYGL
jgi:glutamine synthetase